MQVEEYANVPGLRLFIPRPYSDERGVVYEVFNGKAMKKLGLPEDFELRHMACLPTRFGAIRGIHGGPALSKLSTVFRGRAMCAIVDCRPDSPKFGNVQVVTLTPGVILYIPAGCGNSAAGWFEGETIYVLAFNQPWTKDLDSIKINPVKSGLDIDWPFTIMSGVGPIVAERDLQSPSFREWADTLK